MYFKYKILHDSCFLNSFLVFLFYLLTAVAVLSKDLVMASAGAVFQQSQGSVNILSVVSLSKDFHE